MLKLACVVSGGGTNLQALIDAIECGAVPNAEIALVVATNNRAYALERAKNHGIEAVVLAKKDFNATEARESALLELLKGRNIGLIVLCGSLMIFSEEFIKAFGKPIINIHPSLLPKYGGKGFYGLKVHEAALQAGESETGATVHYVDEGIDTGSIILQKSVAVLPGDTPETLQKRVMEEAEWQILPQAVTIIAKEAKQL